MNLQQLEIFVAVFDNRGFSAAAEKLHLTQPTVSTHIASLEKELQTELINRTTRTFEPTVAGEKLYNYGTSILNLHKKALRELSSSEQNSLSIGVSSTPGHCILPRILSSFHKENPKTDFNIERSDSLDIINRVCDGDLDIGFVGTKIDSDCSFVHIMSDELVIATPYSKRYLDKKKRGISSIELLNEPFLFRRDQSGTMAEIHQYLKRIDREENSLNIVAYINDAGILRECIVNGLGISILSRSTVEKLAKEKKILLFPLLDNSPNRSIYIAYRKSKYISPIIKEFITFSSNFKLEEIL